MTTKSTGLEPDRLDWDRIGQRLGEAERKDGDAPGMPLDDFLKEIMALADTDAQNS